MKLLAIIHAIIENSSCSSPRPSGKSPPFPGSCCGVGWQRACISAPSPSAAYFVAGAFLYFTNVQISQNWPQVVALAFTNSSRCSAFLYENAPRTCWSYRRLLRHVPTRDADASARARLGALQCNASCLRPHQSGYLKSSLLPSLPKSEGRRELLAGVGQVHCRISPTALQHHHLGFILIS